jgi:Cerato-platanin
MIEASTVSSQTWTYTHDPKPPSIMKLIPFIIALTAVFTSASSALVEYDPVYDNGAASMDIVACSNGPNGLETKGYKTFGSLPSFPYIGAADAIEGYDSTSCGSCYKISYMNNTIYVTAIDHAKNGFVISETALTKLGGQQAVDAGMISASATQVNGSYCGF